MIFETLTIFYTIILGRGTIIFSIYNLIIRGAVISKMLTCSQADAVSEEHQCIPQLPVASSLTSCFSKQNAPFRTETIEVTRGEEKLRNESFFKLELPNK